MNQRNTPPLKWGTIVRVKLDKRRPAVVYTPDHLIPKSDEVDVAGISSSYRPDNPDHVPLPHHPGGPTKLAKPSSIQLSLLGKVKKEDLELTWGFVPRKYMNRFDAKLKAKGKP